jgi:hypothetical protein
MDLRIFIARRIGQSGLPIHGFNLKTPPVAEKSFENDVWYTYHVLTGSVTLELLWRTAPSPAQITQVNTFVATYDWTPKRQLTIEEIVTAIRNMTNAQQSNLFAKLVAYFCRENEEFAQFMNVATEVNA